ncbi:MAG: hypothetical protein ACE5IB_07600 [Candidatus Geothermarchaeales archaeon]
MKRLFLACLAGALILMFLMPSPEASSEEAVEVSVHHSILFQSYSGGVVYETVVTLSNPGSESVVAPSIFEIGYLEETADRITYSNASLGNATILNVATQKEGGSTFFVVEIGDEVTIPPEDPVVVSFWAFAHSVLTNPETDEYVATVPDHPLFKARIRFLETVVDPPPGFDPVEFPDRYSRGASENLTLSLEDVDPGILSVSDITFNAHFSARVYQVFAEIGEEIEFGPEGVAHVTDRLDIRNRGKNLVRKDISVRYRYPEGATNFEATSLLGLKVDTGITGDPSIPLPYDIPGGGGYTVILRYDVPISSETWGLVQRTERYSVAFRNPLEMLADTVEVVLKAPGGRIFSSETFSKVSPFLPQRGVEEILDLEGEFSYSIFEVHRGLFGPLSYLVLLGSLVYAGYRFLPVRVMGGVSAETRKYLRVVQQQLSALDQLLRLEERYTRKRIKRKVYMRRRTEIYHKLSEIGRTLGSKRTALLGRTELTERDRGVLKRAGRVEQGLSELRGVEREYSNRRLAFQEYRSKKTRLLKELRRRGEQVSTHVSAFAE